MISASKFLLGLSWAGVLASVQAQTIQAVTEDAPPYTYAEQGKVTGPVTDIVEQSLQRAGFKDYRLHLYPWARAYSLAQKQPHVLIFLIARTPAREALFHWAGEIMKIEYHLYRWRGRAVEVPPLPLTPVAPGHLGLVAVAPGDGLARILASLGASAIVDGGQSQNPSTEEILTAISDLPTDQVVILPNNKNIILAAQQAAQLSPKQVAVVPSRSVPQGIAAMMQFAPSGSLADVSAAMERSLSTVQTGEVTVATRTVELNGVAVNEGQVIGLLNGQIAVAENDLSATVLRLLERMAASEPEVIGLYYGQDVTEAAAEQVAEAIRERFPDLSVELHDGGQPHYRFIISAE